MTDKTNSESKVNTDTSTSENNQKHLEITVSVSDNAQKLLTQYLKQLKKLSED